MTSTPPPPRKRNWLAIVAAASAIGMSVGFGTCGLSLTMHNQRLSSVLIEGGTFLFFGSLIVLVVTLLVAIVLGIIGAIRK